MLTRAGLLKHFPFAVSFFPRNVTCIVLPESLLIHDTLHFELIFGSCAFRNLLLWAKIFHDCLHYHRFQCQLETGELENRLNVSLIQKDFRVFSHSGSKSALLCQITDNKVEMQQILSSPLSLEDSRGLKSLSKSSKQINEQISKASLFSQHGPS